MDFTAELPRWHDQHRQVSQLLNGQSVVLCLGSRALLIATTHGLPPSLTLVGAATGAAAGLRRVADHQPRLLICSDQLEEGCGSQLVVQVKRRHPAVQTLLVVSQAHHRARLRAAIEGGCDALIADWRLGHGALIDALRSLCSGGSYIDRQLRAAAMQPAAAADPPLSRREREVIGHAMRGENNEEIARQLRVSPETVKSHMARVLRKLGARDRTHAVALALVRGLVDVSPVEGRLG